MYFTGLNTTSTTNSLVKAYMLTKYSQDCFVLSWVVMFIRNNEKYVFLI